MVFAFPLWSSPEAARSESPLSGFMPFVQLRLIGSTNVMSIVHQGRITDPQTVEVAESAMRRNNDFFFLFTKKNFSFLRTWLFRSFFTCDMWIYHCGSSIFSSLFLSEDLFGIMCILSAFISSQWIVSYLLFECCSVLITVQVAFIRFSSMIVQCWVLFK